MMDAGYWILDIRFLILIKDQGLLNIVNPAIIPDQVSSILSTLRNNICFIDSEKIYLDTFEYNLPFYKKQNPLL